MSVVYISLPAPVLTIDTQRHLCILVIYPQCSSEAFSRAAAATTASVSLSHNIVRCHLAALRGRAPGAVFGPPQPTGEQPKPMVRAMQPQDPSKQMLRKAIENSASQVPPRPQIRTNAIEDPAKAKGRKMSASSRSDIMTDDR